MKLNDSPARKKKLLTQFMWREISLIVSPCSATNLKGSGGFDIISLVQVVRSLMICYFIAMLYVKR